MYWIFSFIVIRGVVTEATESRGLSDDRAFRKPEWRHPGQNPGSQKIEMFYFAEKERLIGCQQINGDLKFTIGVRLYDFEIVIEGC